MPPDTLIGDYCSPSSFEATGPCKDVIRAGLGDALGNTDVLLRLEDFSYSGGLAMAILEPGPYHNEECGDTCFPGWEDNRGIHLPGAKHHDDPSPFKPTPHQRAQGLRPPELEPDSASRAPALASLYWRRASARGRPVRGPAISSSLFSINEDDPVKSIPTPEERDKNPLEFGYYLQDMILRGEDALHAKQWDRVAKYYEALARAVPDRAISFSRLCRAYAELGKDRHRSCQSRAAMELGGAMVIDHIRFVNLTLSKAKLTPADFTNMDRSLVHLREHLAQHPPKAAAKPLLPTEVPAKDKQEELPVNMPLEVEVLAWHLGVRAEDAGRLSTCLTALQSVHAPESVIVPFEWSAAILTKDPSKASAVLARAKSAGLPDAAIAGMRAGQARDLCAQRAHRSPQALGICLGSSSNCARPCARRAAQANRRG